MRKYFWPLAFALILFFRSFAPGYLVEELYSRNLYLFLHALLGKVFGFLPFPAVYVLVIALLFFLIFRWYRRQRKLLSFSERASALLHGVLTLVSALGFFFILFWGLNYARLPVEKQLGLSLRPLTTEELLAEYEQVLEVLFAERQKLLTAQNMQSDTSALALPAVSEELIRAALERVLARHAYPTNLRVRLRELPRGSLLRIGTAGVYLAWSGEGHYDGGLHSIQKPFVMAHEMAHGYGFGDEGICNFWAWLACTESGHPALRYSANLAYWRYLQAALRQIAPERARKLQKNLPKGIQKDLEAIRQQMSRYPDILPDLRDWAYETYLKSQGVKEGMKSYSRLPVLVKAYTEAQRE